MRSTGWVRPAGALAAVLALAPAAGAAVDFAPRVNLRVAPSAAALGSGDLNGDGIPDLVVAHDRSGATVLTGTGVGGLRRAATLPTGARPVAVAIADLDADGRSDIVTADSGAGTLTVLRGDGAGGALDRRVVPVGRGPISVAAGDVTGDGIPDLAVANVTAGTLTLLRGAGDLTFAAETVDPGNDTAFDTAIADVTGDGLGDLVAAGGNVFVLPGPPRSAPGAESPAIAFPARLAVADMNRDGRLDIVSANTFANTTTVFLGLGGGVFRRLAARPASALPAAIAVADVTGDGIPDAVAANAGSNDVSVQEGRGDGSVRPGRQFRAGRNPVGVIAADVTADGRADLFVANATGTISVLVARAAAPGRAGTAIVRTRCRAPRRVVAATSIGCVAVGMSPAQVVEILGPPRRIARAAGDYAYRYPGLVVGFAGDANAVELVASARRGVGFPNGVRVGAPAALVRSRFPRARCTSRAGVRFCEVVRGTTFTGIVDAGGIIREIDVGTVE